jgi:hypothetical protein
MAEQSITYRRTLEQIAANRVTNHDMAGWAAKALQEIPTIPRHRQRLVTLEAV